MSIYNEQQLINLLPCKAGDVLYVPYKMSKCVLHYTVQKLVCDEKGYYIVLTNSVKVPLSAIGDDYFLTYSEAEEALNAKNTSKYVVKRSSDNYKILRNKLNLKKLIADFQETIDEMKHYECQLNGESNEWAVRYWMGRRDTIHKLIDFVTGEEHSTQTVIELFCTVKE